LRRHLHAAREESDVHERSRNVIERQVSQLTRLVDDLMDISRVSSGMVRLQLIDVNQEKRRTDNDP